MPETITRRQLVAELAAARGLAEAGADQMLFDALMDGYVTSCCDDEGNLDVDPGRVAELPAAAAIEVGDFIDDNADTIAYLTERAVDRATGAVVAWAEHGFVAGLEVMEVARLSWLSADRLAEASRRAGQWRSRNGANPAAQRYFAAERQARIRKRLTITVQQVIEAGLQEGASIEQVVDLTGRRESDVAKVAATLR